MSIEDFQKQVAAADTVGRLNSLVNSSFAEFYGWPKAAREQAMEAWAARRAQLLSVDTMISPGSRVGAGDALAAVVPGERPSCHRRPSEPVLAERVSSPSAVQFANTETKREATLPSVGQSAESSKGLDRTVYKPLMQKPSADAAIPIGITDGNILQRDAASNL